LSFAVAMVLVTERKPGPMEVISSTYRPTTIGRKKKKREKLCLIISPKLQVGLNPEPRAKTSPKDADESNGGGPTDFGR